jgi:hypothetical protein
MRHRKTIPIELDITEAQIVKLQTDREADKLFRVRCFRKGSAVWYSITGATQIQKSSLYFVSEIW